MPVALGLHVLVALFFAVHAIRNGQQIYWLLILFSFPLLGSVVYFFAIYLPNSRLQSGARKVVATATRALDPSRELREARAAFDYTATAQNRMRLASALLDAGLSEEAAINYEACLTGPFASDLEIRLGAGRAYVACNRCADALRQLQLIRQGDAGFRAEEIALLMGESLAGAGDIKAAGAEFEAAYNRFGTFQCLAEYAIWTASSGDPALAERLQANINQAMARWSRHTRELNAPLTRRVNSAYDAAKSRPKEQRE